MPTPTDLVALACTVTSVSFLAYVIYQVGRSHEWVLTQEKQAKEFEKEYPDGEENK